VGSSSLTEKRKLEGRHWVYNITVANTHNYLVGTEGFLVHNDCGDLDVLATKFMQNFSPQLKKLQIAEWWAKGFPEFFTRGTFFEKLMAKSPKYSGWTITPHTWEVIDFQKVVGNTVKVVSMKTTITKDVTSWMSSNADHLGKLNNMQKKWAKEVPNKQEYRELHIYVKDIDLGDYGDWVRSIKTKYPNIKNVVISSLEKEFSL
jgi:hypothetical protein